MGVDIKVNWSISEWRRFFGFADMTSLIELASLASDRLNLAMIHRSLDQSTALNAALEKDAKALGKESITKEKMGARRADQPINEETQNAE